MKNLSESEEMDGQMEGKVRIPKNSIDLADTLPFISIVAISKLQAHLFVYKFTLVNR